MAPLQPMPQVVIPEADLRRFGARWLANGERLSRTPPESSMQFGRLFDSVIAECIATMLGGIPIVTPNRNALTPPQPDCVEKGEVRIIGGVRPQNFDIGYRPDGVRIAYDMKTLNDRSSVRKNYQNMINDLATEATTVHTRFPYAVFAFVFVVPAPCLGGSIESAVTLTLERLAQREEFADPDHLAEVAALIVWDPGTGAILADRPAPNSNLRIETFHSRMERIYRRRYKGLPPHVDAPEVSGGEVEE
jgi:hypothetical protein